MIPIGSPRASLTSKTVSKRLIENWEDNDIDEYTGVTSKLRTQTSVVYEGTYSGALNSGSKLNYVGSKPGSNADDLTNYPEQGDRFRAFVRDDGNYNVEPFVLFGMQTEPDGTNSTVDSTGQYYIAVYRPGHSQIKLDKRNAGNTTSLDSMNGLSLPTGEWAEIVVTWHSDDLIEVTFTDSSGSYTLSGTDSTFAGAVGFGWGMNQDSNTTDGYLGLAEILEKGAY